MIFNRAYRQVLKLETFQRGPPASAIGRTERGKIIEIHRRSLHTEEPFPLYLTCLVTRLLVLSFVTYYKLHMRNEYTRLVYCVENSGTAGMDQIGKWRKNRDTGRGGAGAPVFR